MSKPRLAHWLKYHYCVLRWVPFGGRIWRWADERMERWHRSQDEGRYINDDISLASRMATWSECSLGPSWFVGDSGMDKLFPGSAE